MTWFNTMKKRKLLYSRTNSFKKYFYNESSQNVTNVFLYVRMPYKYILLQTKNSAIQNRLQSSARSHSRRSDREFLVQFGTNKMCTSDYRNFDHEIDCTKDFEKHNVGVKSKLPFNPN